MFSCANYEIFKKSFFTELLQWLLLTVSGFQPENLSKKDSGKDVFLLILENLEEHLLTVNLRMTASYFYLWILRSFSAHLIFSWPLENCLFHVQMAEFQPADTVKKYFKGAFQAIYKRMRMSLSKAFIYLK